MTLFNKVMKHHTMQHLHSKFLNPRVRWTFASEDFVGKIPILTASVSPCVSSIRLNAKVSPQVQNSYCISYLQERGCRKQPHMWRKVRGRWRGIPWTRYYLAFETGHGMAPWKKCKAPWKICAISKDIWKGINAKDCTERNCKRLCHLKKGSFLAKTKTDLTWDTGSKKVCACVCWSELLILGWKRVGFQIDFCLQICSLSDWFLNQSNQSQNIDFRPKSILIKDYWLESIFDAQGNSHVVTMSVLCRHHVVSMPMCHVRTMSSL